jgi:ABC-type glutathione transport system ATPase component
MTATQVGPGVNPSGPAPTTSKYSEVVVAVRGLTKIFKDFWGRPKARAVDGVDFEVRRGRCSVCWDPMAPANPPP